MSEQCLKTTEGALIVAYGVAATTGPVSPSYGGSGRLCEIWMVPGTHPEDTVRYERTTE